MEKIAAILIILTSLGYSLCVPNIYFSLGFDVQNLLTWKYGQSIGLFPYRDVFYPYGLLSYVQGTNVFWRLIYAGETLVLLYFYLILFKKLFKNSYFTYLSFLYFYVVVTLHPGLDSFIRYGVITTFAVMLSLHFEKTIYLAPWKITFFGIIGGAIFSLWTDQGIYAVIASFFFIIVNSLIKNGFKDLLKKKYYVNVLLSLILFVVGFIVALIPFLFYLVINDSLGDFLLSIRRLGDISLFAKTPFFYSLRSQIAIFNFATLFVSISYLSFRYFFIKKKFNDIDYVLIGLTVALFLLEQKSIIRSIEIQLAFISVLITLIFFYIFFQKSLGLRLNRNKYLLLSVVFVSYLYVIIFVVKYNLIVSCVDTINNPKDLFERKNVLKNLGKSGEEYSLVLETINKQKNSIYKIFSFPGDPIFYMLNEQKPPYFFTVYEGTPLYGQNKRIEYIEKNNIEYVILNTKVRAIVDGVPDYIRSPREFAYILTHFAAVDSVGDFLILKRQRHIPDFFSNKLPDNFKDFRSFLLTVDLKSIPRSEGIYKKGYLSKIDSIGFKNKKLLNAHLSSHEVNSANRLLVVESKNGKNRDDLKVKIRTFDGKETKITFYACEDNIPCIINLKNIPLFYINRSIKEIDISAENINMVKLVEYKQSDRFW